MIDYFCRMKSKHSFLLWVRSVGLIVTLMLVSQCSSSQAQQVPQVKRISNQELQDILQNMEDVQLIDVRTPDEYGQGHLENAQLIDFLQSDFKEKVSKLDRDKPIVVYCAVGGRSAQSAKILESLGFKEIYDLKKGIRGWLAENLPVTNN